MEARDPGCFRLLSLYATAASMVSLLSLPQCPFLAPQPEKHKHRHPFGILLHGQHGAHWEVPPALASGIFHEREEVGRREAERGQLERKGGAGKGFWWR